MNDKREIELIFQDERFSVIREPDGGTYSLVLSSEITKKLWSMFEKADQVFHEIPRSPELLPLDEFLSYFGLLMCDVTRVEIKHKLSSGEIEPEKWDAYSSLLDAFTKLDKLSKYKK